MTEQDYLLAWGVYAVAALGCLLVWLRMTGWIWRWLREPLRLLVAVLLLTPTIVDPARDLYAPAIAVTALDVLFKVGNNAWHAVADLAIYGVIAFAVWLLFAALRWPLERWWQGRQGAPAQVPAEDEPTLREMMARDDERYDADTRTDARGDRRLRIEPRL
ncbi:MFS transporter [Pseudomonas alcaligenes]|uniref:MFS transporter n=1 Tax=Aquipseudomonas alcaligenes TaxID=43263 RepID=A0ABR7S1C7_AQUAC|nr:MFS transporter [Pseudomonas alcaligenes]MBC9250198.1 MFS transporter [Pseudomonas alcaligenes]